MTPPALFFFLQIALSICTFKYRTRISPVTAAGFKLSSTVINNSSILTSKVSNQIIPSPAKASSLFSPGFLPFYAPPKRIFSSFRKKPFSFTGCLASSNCSCRLIMVSFRVPFSTVIFPSFSCSSSFSSFSFLI